MADPAPTHLGWDAQTGTAGSGTIHDLLSGALLDLRAQAGFGSACTLGAGLVPSVATDARVPAVGDGFYYLVRAGNSCSTGTVGDGSATPDARDALDVSTPGVCQ